MSSGYLLPTWGDRIAALIALVAWLATTVAIIYWLEKQRQRRP